MDFKKHSELAGRHAFLSASNPSWVNYDEDKLGMVFANSVAAQRGTELHELAQRLIRLKVKLPETPSTLNMYVNDAIGFRMTPELLLRYSDNAFGTADAVSFRDNILRIHDLKTGLNEAAMTQLEVYAAFFCLEYHFRPFQIGMELRIYQNDEIKILEPDPDKIFHIMDKIVTFDRYINAMREEVR